MSSSPGTPPPRPTQGTDPWEGVIAGIAPVLARRLAALGLPVGSDSLIGQIDRPSGIAADLAFPVHRYAKQAAAEPVALAAQIAQDLSVGAEIARVEASGGFVNFHAAPGWLVENTLGPALAPGRPEGHPPAKGPAVCVEHTSANPTGPFHMGRVRNAIIGDTA